MSYKSDVRFRLLKKDYNKLEDAYLREFENEEEYYTNFWEYKDVFKIEKGGTIFFGWNSVKWYRMIEDFDEVNFIMDFILGLTDYAYAIIGENLEDNDVDSNGGVPPINIIREFEDDEI